MPALAGTAGMRYPKFLAFNAAGGLVWGSAVVLLGYLAGDSYGTIERTFGRATALIVLTAVVIAAVTWRVRRRSARSNSPIWPSTMTRAPIHHGPPQRSTRSCLVLASVDVEVRADHVAALL
jgi:hypothetical protein